MILTTSFQACDPSHLLQGHQRVLSDYCRTYVGLMTAVAGRAGLWIPWAQHPKDWQSS